MDLILLEPGDAELIFGKEPNDWRTGGSLIDHVWRDAAALKDLGQCMELAEVVPAPGAVPPDWRYYLVETLATEGTISTLDERGVLGGVVSGVCMGPDQYLRGSVKLMVDGFFAMRLTSLTGH